MRAKLVTLLESCIVAVTPRAVPRFRKVGLVAKDFAALTPRFCPERALNVLSRSAAAWFNRGMPVRDESIER